MLQAAAVCLLLPVVIIDRIREKSNKSEMDIGRFYFTQPNPRVARQPSG